MKRVGLIFGGISNEAEVSIMSAKNVVKNIDRKLFELILIYRDKDWFFYLLEDIDNLDVKQKISLNDFSGVFDVALLMTHGKYGEDGVIQWMLESQNIKYCGCRVLSSALCMDKAVFRDVLSKFDIKQTKYWILDFNKNSKLEIENIKNNCLNDFNFPLYIKPANSGSSVGITKIDNARGLDIAIEDALKHDSKILIEEWVIDAKEIEVAVMGNSELTISAPWELILTKEFYDYDDKYNLGQTKVEIPANISDELSQEIRDLAGKIYKICDCQWFARIDFFVKNEEIYLNEINTLPGFTDISMFPMLMKDSGIEYSDLITRIIELGY